VASISTPHLDDQDEHRHSAGEHRLGAPRRRACGAGGRLVGDQLGRAAALDLDPAGLDQAEQRLVGLEVGERRLVDELAERAPAVDQAEQLLLVLAQARRRDRAAP
jgi:hypothetical protein